MTFIQKRHKFRLVDRDIQLGLAWRMMLAFSMFLLLGLVLIFSPSMLRLATGSRIEEIEPAAREFLVLHKRIWPAVFVTFAGVFLYTLRISHKIAGPIYRINTTLMKMIEGERPEKVKLRDGDYFHDTAELLQRLSHKLSSNRE